MSKTAQLLALAEAATSKSMISVIPFRVAANPETIKQLVELVRLQHETLLELEPYIPAKVSAIEAFNNFERNL